MQSQHSSSWIIGHDRKGCCQDISHHKTSVITKESLSCLCKPKQKKLHSRDELDRGNAFKAARYIKRRIAEGSLDHLIITIIKSILGVGRCDEMEGLGGSV